MKVRVLWRYAIAETRRSRGTLFFCLISIAVGVASLTGVRSVIDGVRDGMQQESRRILGADLSFKSNAPLSTGAGQALTDELVANGAERADVVQFYSMVARSVAREAKKGPRARLVRVRAVSQSFPLYGQVETEPQGAFSRLGDKPFVVAAEAVLVALGLSPGDRVKLGDLEFEVLAALESSPGGVSGGFGFAPVVMIADTFLSDTGLIRQGSRIGYTRLFRTAAEFDVESFKNENWDRALEANLNIQTARESAANVQRFLSRLARFLTVVGLITLLLGALGIGSAMNVFIRGKLDNAAVFRCLGATASQVFTIYSGVALVIGLIGSVLGVFLGSLIPLAVNAAADELGGSLLPVDVSLGFSPIAAVHGLTAGVLATAVFALLPIYRIGRVSPLRVMRRAVEQERLALRDLVARGAAAVLSIGFILALTAVETESLKLALFFTAAVAVGVLLLTAVSRLLMFTARRIIPNLPSYHLRQGLANLHRPGNQTGSVLTAVGVGVLLLVTIAIIESSLQATIAIENRDDLPNIFLVDVQPDQKDGVQSLVMEAGVENFAIAPMVAARISALNGQGIDRSTVAKNAVNRSWQDRMRTREYFVSYRADAVEGEEVLEGAMWRGRPETQEASVDYTLATNLGIQLGDRLTLDVQGIPVDSTVTSLRRIRWQSMRPNSMILLSPGEIENAPKMFVASFRVADESARFELQDELVEAFPNISVVDVTEAADNVRYILDRISLILGFLTLLTVVCGAIILGGSVAAGRFARLRESMLLKVLGASRRDLRRILVAEYAVLAGTGGLAGWLLAEAINRPALAWFFDAPAVVPYRWVVAACGGVIALNIAVGLLISRGVGKARPLDVLRED